MSSLRIGEVAARTGTTTRTIRYYEEIGLLPATDERPSGSHRTYDEEDVTRLQEVLRLKHLLGVSLDELRELVAAEAARAALREEWHKGAPGEARRAGDPRRGAAAGGAPAGPRGAPPRGAREARGRAHGEAHVAGGAPAAG